MKRTDTWIAGLSTFALLLVLLSGRAEAQTAPELIFPKDGSVHTDFPRKGIVTWKAVAGATGYEVQIQYNDGAWKMLKNEKVAGNVTRFPFEFIGANPGRVRVCVLGLPNNPHNCSPEHNFKWTK